MSNADELMYEEVVRILEYIQAHASVQDDNGVIHNANIIWGTSEKPQLGNAIELVVVATGFETDDLPGMKPDHSARAGGRGSVRAQAPVAAPALEPVKPAAPQRAPQTPCGAGGAGRQVDALRQHRDAAFQARLPVAQLEVRRADARRPQGGAARGERRAAGARGAEGRFAVRLTHTTRFGDPRFLDRVQRFFGPYRCARRRGVAVALRFGTRIGCRDVVFLLSHNDVRRLKARGTASSEAVLRLLGDVDMLLATILVVNNLVNICIVILTSGIVDALFTFVRFWSSCSRRCWSPSCCCSSARCCPRCWRRPRPCALRSSSPSRLSSCGGALSAVVHPRADQQPHQRKGGPQERNFTRRAGRCRRHDAGFQSRGTCHAVGNRQLRQYRSAGNHEAARRHHGAGTHRRLRKVKRTIIASGFSRIPVFEEDIDNIRGTLYVKDLLPYINHGNEFGWQQLIRKPYFVPEHKKINDLLGDFQTNKVHMAIVVDEYGSTLGLVSLEDIIEEIVGEISDESDNDERFYTRLNAKSYLFDGKTHIGDFERILSLDEETFLRRAGRR